MYGSEDNAPVIWIVSHRKINDSIFRLPETYKVSKRLQHDVIAKTWPTLLNYPFNRPAHITDAWLHALTLPRIFRAVRARTMRSLRRLAKSF
jgi:hypothetical protein